MKFATNFSILLCLFFIAMIIFSPLKDTPAEPPNRTLIEHIRYAEIQISNVIRLHQAEYQEHQHVKTIWDTTGGFINIEYYFTMLPTQIEPHVIELQMDTLGELHNLRIVPKIIKQ